MHRYLDDLQAALENCNAAGAEEIAALEQLVKSTSGTSAENVFGTTQVIQRWKSKEHFCVQIFFVWFQILSFNGF